MRKILLFAGALLVVCAGFYARVVYAGGPIFDLRRADYFDNAHFSFIQTFKKTKNPSGQH